MSKFISFFLLIMSGLLLISTTSINKRPSAELANFIISHSEKVSSCLSQNGEILFTYKPNESLPISSTTKILVAAAYADQASKGEIDLDESISIQKIKNLYLPNEKNKKFDSWIKKHNDAKLSELVRAMIKYNSNAIEEFLIGNIGLQKTNSIIEILNLKSHSKIVPPVSLQIAINGKKQVTAGNKPLIIKEALTIHSDIINGTLNPSKTGLTKSNESNINQNLQAEATTKEYTILLDNILGYQNLNDDLIDQMLPFLMDITFDENGSEVYRDQPSVIQSFGSQDFYNVIIYNKEPSSDERFVCSYFFEGLTTKEINALESNIKDLIENIKDEDNLDQVISDLTSIAFD